MPRVSAPTSIPTFALWRCDPVTEALVVVGIMAGLGFGGLAGWRGGRWAVGFPERYWTLNSSAFFGSLLLDLVGLYVHQAWISYGAIGLMAGLITGLKYGYSPELRLWEPQPELPDDPDDAGDDADDAGDEDDPSGPDAAGPEDADGAPKDAAPIADDAEDSAGA